MTKEEIFQRWNDVIQDLRRSIHTVNLIQNLVRDALPDERRACEAISDNLIQAFTMSKIQYKKYEGKFVKNEEEFYRG